MYYPHAAVTLSDLQFTPGFLQLHAVSSSLPRSLSVHGRILSLAGTNAVCVGVLDVTLASQSTAGDGSTNPQSSSGTTRGVFQQ
jgi:hypothetical protein